jgi:microcystin-dependent protein
MATFYVGQIVTVGFNFAPTNMALCNGQLLAINQNAALFSILGTTYGGNGTTTFALPNLQSRRMIHWGQGQGLSNYIVGQAAGAETTTVTINNMAAHTHTMTSTFKASSTVKAADQIPAPGGVLGHTVDVATGGTAHPAIYCPSGTATDAALGGLNVSAGLTGGGQPFQSLTPYLAITMVIALFGIFPSRN